MVEEERILPRAVDHAAHLQRMITRSNILFFHFFQALIRLEALISLCSEIVLISVSDDDGTYS
jgi:hypothetical protein